MYERFYDELFEPGSLTIKEREAPNKYKVLESSSEEQPSMEYTITLPDADTASCEYGLFNHVGILCKHAIKVKYADHIPHHILLHVHQHFVTNHQAVACQVLVHLDYQEIPKNNILKRRTMAATVSENIIPFTDKSTSDGAIQMMKRTLLIKTLELVSGNGEIGEQAFIEAMNALSAAKSNNVGKGNGSPADIVNHDDSEQNVPLGCPERTYKGGCPHGTGLNAWLLRKRKHARKPQSTTSPSRQPGQMKNTRLTQKQSGWPICSL
jgi:hypothetical protein